MSIKFVCKCNFYIKANNNKNNKTRIAHSYGKLLDSVNRKLWCIIMNQGDSDCFIVYITTLYARSSVVPESKTGHLRNKHELILFYFCFVSLCFVFCLI